MMPSKSRTVVLLSLVTLCGCAGQTTAEAVVGLNTSADKQLNVISRVFLNGGSEVIEFYEPTPGHVLVSMAGGSLTSKPSFQADDLRGHSPLEVFAMVAPGERAPESLVAANERLSARTATPTWEAGDAGLIQEPSASPGALATQSSTGAGNGYGSSGWAPPSTSTPGYCRNKWLSDFPCQCPTGAGGAGAKYCWCLTDQSGQQSTWVTNGTRDEFNVCPLAGSVTLQVSGTNSGAWTVPQDTYRWFFDSGLRNCGFLWLSTCGTLNETGTVVPNGSALYNWQGYLNW
jgi:hypothetical protein